MKIGIIGAGNIAFALGNGWLKSGHNVVFGVRNPQSDKSTLLKQKIAEAPILSVTEALDFADVIAITTPADAALEFAELLKKHAQKIIIDCTNAIRVKPLPYQTAYEAIEAIAGAQHLVKCFNTTGYENLLNPVYSDKSIDLFCAGDSTEAKAIVRQLAIDLGFAHCYDFGGSKQVELLEAFARAWINLAIVQGMGRNIAFNLVTR